MNTDKNAYGAVFAIAGLALCMIAGLMVAFFTKWRECAPLVREWLIGLSYRVNEFADWLNGPQFWIGVCLTITCLAIGIALAIFLDRDEF